MRSLGPPGKLVQPGFRVHGGGEHRDGEAEAGRHRVPFREDVSRRRTACRPPQLPTRGTAATEAYWPTVMSYRAVTQVEHFDDVPAMARSATVVVDAIVRDVIPTRLVGREKGGDPGVQYHGMVLDVRRVLRGTLASETAGRTFDDVVELILSDPAPASPAAGSASRPGSGHRGNP